MAHIRHAKICERRTQAAWVFSVGCIEQSGKASVPLGPKPRTPIGNILWPSKLQK